MSVTQQTIANHLGLARSVVAEALNGHPRISERTRERVRLAALELGYSSQSNLDARNLIARRYGTKVKKNAFAVLMPSYESEPIRKVPYYVPLLDGIEMEANRRVMDLSLHCLPDGVVPRYVSEFLVDGIISFTMTVERNQWLHSHGLPVVFIDGRNEQFCRTFPDHKTGISLCTQHLIDLGHRRIAYFGQKGVGEYPTATERFDAFAETMSRNGLTIDPELNWRDASIRMRRESASAAMAEVLARRPQFTAIVCYNDLLALGVTDALRSVGLSVPTDVSITGFDDVSVFYSGDTPITSVWFDREEVGREAVSMLYELVDASVAQPTVEPVVREKIFPVKFVERGSTIRVQSK